MTMTIATREPGRRIHAAGGLVPTVARVEAPHPDRSARAAETRQALRMLGRELRAARSASA